MEKLKTLSIKFSDSNPEFIILQDKFYIKREECDSFIKRYDFALGDGIYTLKRISNELYLFSYGEIEWRIQCDIPHLFSVISKVKVPTVVKIEKFQMRTHPFPVRNWSQILFHENLDKRAYAPIKRIMSEKRHLLEDLKGFLSRYLDNARVYADGWGKYDFYFDGRNIENGCGFNGGFIYHDYDGGKMSIHT